MDRTWKLSKYARWSAVTKDWQITDSDKDQELRLTLTKSKHLVVSFGHHSVQENFSLWNAVSTVKAFIKDDSMLVVCQIKLNESRRFRIQFAESGDCSAVKNCQQASQIISTLMPVKELGKANSAEEKATPSEVPLKSLVEMLTDDKSSLPRAYRRATTLPPNSLKTMIRLCLSDCNFPAFVGQVEKELNAMKSEKLC
ncbi:hypothetical protein CAPTEDRAFT_194956 [Capitella teleta]|uniref:Meiotic recombination protein REC114 n=1 Tax=Capitella teleta TaxID=283909 RepID=R7VGT7_CAPTE|nr:hypothetical protein CAPTEDRAFT_194956 [Capitella teleta]|eukprot:ELU17819.1 hypothetical protein CAPTEDRAFT_194956 [Capitella teleta]